MKECFRSHFIHPRHPSGSCHPTLLPAAPPRMLPAASRRRVSAASPWRCRRAPAARCPASDPSAGCGCGGRRRQCDATAWRRGTEGGQPACRSGPLRSAGECLRAGRARAHRAQGCAQPTRAARALTCCVGMPARSPRRPPPGAPGCTCAGQAGLASGLTSGLARLRSSKPRRAAARRHANLPACPPARRAPAKHALPGGAAARVHAGVQVAPRRKLHQKDPALLCIASPS